MPVFWPRHARSSPVRRTRTITGRVRATRAAGPVDRDVRDHRVPLALGRPGKILRGLTLSPNALRWKAQHVKLLLLDLLHTRKQVVKLVGDGQKASRQPIVGACGKAQTESASRFWRGPKVLGGLVQRGQPLGRASGPEICGYHIGPHGPGVDGEDADPSRLSLGG